MVVSVRIPDEDLRYLKLVAQVNDQSVGKLIRESVHAEIEKQKKSPEFRDKAKKMLKSHQEILSELLGR